MAYKPKKLVLEDSRGYVRAGKLNLACNKCAYATGKAVRGQSLCPLPEVLLIVISAYPGVEEVKEGGSLIPVAYPSGLNAGGYLRGALIKKFSLEEPSIENFYNRVYRTNAVKCSPGGKVINPDTSAWRDCLVSCKGWLLEELADLPPKVPILLAGATPIHSLIGLGETLYNCRGEVYDVMGHPTVVTLNPIEGEKMSPKREKNGKLMVEFPPALLSAPWLIFQDLERVKHLVLEYIANERGGGVR